MGNSKFELKSESDSLTNLNLNLMLFVALLHM